MTDNDRELLELAAKAAGIELDNAPRYNGWLTTAGGARWNPLTSDGDALRLAVKLRLEIDHNHPQDNDGWVMALENGKMAGPTETVDGESGRFAATRRAIVRAAAEIGKAMP